MVEWAAMRSPVVVAVVANLAVAAALSAAVLGGSSTTATASGPTVTATRQSTRVSDDMPDSLSPLPRGTTGVLPATAVLNRLDTGPDAAYVRNRHALTLTLGSYTNPNAGGANGRAIVSEPAYVITGGRSTCVPLGGAPPNQSLTATCTATIIVNARTGAPMILEERGSS
jgi:hypothetical protein